MKKLLALLIIIVYQNVIADYWIQKTNFPGTGRRRPFFFSIGNKGYVGTGANGISMLPDFWEYDQVSDSWTQRANFGGSARVQAIGFSANFKGYAGLGVDNNFLYQDLWEYDPSTNIWTQRTNFNGGLRAAATAFSIDSLGYVCGGYSLSGSIIVMHNDLWEYNPLFDLWTQKANFFGVPRFDATAFSIGNKAYLGLGADTLNVRLQDFWEYDIPADNWTQKANLIGVGRVDCASFSIGSHGFVGTGEVTPQNTYTNTFFEYVPSLDQWFQKANFPGTARDEDIGFTIGNKGYIGLGGQDGSPTFLDLWEYTPDSTTIIQEVNDLKSPSEIYPNPFTNYVSVITNDNEQSEIILYDILSRKLLQEKFTNSISLNTQQLSKGIYLYEVRNKNGVIKNGKVVKE